MKKYILYAVIVFLLTSTTYAIRSCRVVDSLRQQIAMHERNEEAFVNDIERYKTQSGLAGARVAELELSLSDALKVIEEDKETIKELNIKLKDMAQASKTATKTEIKVVERLNNTTTHHYDTIFKDTDNIKYIDVEKPYYDVHAIIVHDTINMDIVTRDSLLIIESVKYKRFLGFLWKTHRIKSRTFDVVSKNPNTIIEDFKVVTVRK